MIENYVMTIARDGGNGKRHRDRLDRTTFSTSRMMDFFSVKELTAQTGYAPRDWALYVLKELVDNALDACEETGVAPEIKIEVTTDSIAVSDNGPGIPAETVEGVLDFTRRVSSREAYVAPDRGAQGNALKTVLAVPFVLDGERGQVVVEAAGVKHEITIRVDEIRQEPAIDHRTGPSRRKAGTKVLVRWPADSASARKPTTAINPYKTTAGAMRPMTKKRLSQTPIHPARWRRRSADSYKSPRTSPG